MSERDGWPEAPSLEDPPGVEDEAPEAEVEAAQVVEAEADVAESEAEVAEPEAEVEAPELEPGRYDAPLPVITIRPPPRSTIPGSASRQER